MLCWIWSSGSDLRVTDVERISSHLCSGKDVPRPHRFTSERVAPQPGPISRLGSVQPALKVIEISAKKKAFQLSESNTAESFADTLASIPITRRKTKDIQSHLGKGRPVIAGGSRARNIIKVVSHGTGCKGKASATLQEGPIPEEGTLI